MEPLEVHEREQARKAVHVLDVQARMLVRRMESEKRRHVHGNYSVLHASPSDARPPRQPSANQEALGEGEWHVMARALFYDDGGAMAFVRHVARLARERTDRQREKLLQRAYS
mgnify:CR=1 FL=1